MRLVVVLVCCVLASVAVAQEALPSRPADPYAARAQDLERELAVVRAELLGRDIALANCNATVDTVRLNNRADVTVKEFQRIYGGEWVWKACQAGETTGCNIPVRVAPKEK